MLEILKSSILIVVFHRFPEFHQLNAGLYPKKSTSRYLLYPLRKLSQPKPKKPEVLTFKFN